MTLLFELGGRINFMHTFDNKGKGEYGGHKKMKLNEDDENDSDNSSNEDEDDDSNPPSS